ncbi:MAG: hypothetical protein K9I85_06360 [Saprospiraceae bacterium]|nr:hypothetical protein [Saprospiraceae bacterium]
MSKAKFLFPVLLFGLGSFSSCGQSDLASSQDDDGMTEANATVSNVQEPHPYGGWFCPDNLRGFPPVDIQDLDKIQVVADRLPTKEETRNGTSLMYFDPATYPDARPLDMHLPRVARIYSRHNGMNERIIVIQAAVVGQDTVVGYRFPSGGNGTAWFREVTFLSDAEVAKIGPAPMVYIHSKIHASKEQIWKAITRTDYARSLGEKFDQKAFFSADWTDDSQVRLHYTSDNEKASGIVATVYGNFYLQIDYDRNGFHYAEKILVMENAEEGTAEMHLVSGPYPNDLGLQTEAWEEWFQKVKRESENK